MICIESLINDSGHKNTQSLDTVIKSHNDVSASHVCHFQIQNCKIKEDTKYIVTNIKASIISYIQEYHNNISR